MLEKKLIRDTVMKFDLMSFGSINDLVSKNVVSISE